MLSDTGFAAHLCRAGGLQLNITIYLTLFWNTIYMDKAASHLAKGLCILFRPHQHLVGHG